MRRKVKTPVLIVGIFFAVLIVVGFILLYVFAIQKTQAATPDTAVMTTEEETTDYYSSALEPIQQEQETPTVAEPISLQQIIINEGLTVDEKGNVVDADGNKYENSYGKIKIVYENKLYTIDVSLIKAVRTPATQPTTKKETTSSKSNNNSTSSKTDTKSDNTNNNSSSSNNSTSSKTNNNNQNNISPPAVEQSPAVVVQKPTVNINNNNNSNSQTTNIRLNYKSMTVNKGDVFSLTLSNANNTVSWIASNSGIVSVYEKNGNQCSFKALSKGNTTVIANYNGVNYTCTVTIK